MPLVAVLLAVPPAGAAAPSAPAAPTLAAGGQQLTATWTAPSGTIDDYDVRWRQTGTSSWQGHPEGGYHKTSNTFGSGPDGDDVGGNDPLDLGTVGLSSFTRESVGGKAGVYKVNSAIDTVRIVFEDRTFTDTRHMTTVPTLTLRAASTKPSSTNLRTHGTSLATSTPIKEQYAYWKIDFTTSTQLSAGSYLWFESDISNRFGWRKFELSNIDLATTQTTKTITGLTDGTSYEVQVRAGNSDGEGAWSASATGTAGSVPSTPAAPTVASRNTSLAVSWTAPTANDPGGITDYDVQYSSDSGTTWTEWSSGTTSTTTSATITGLTNGTTYDVQVRAANAIGESEWSPSTSTKPGLPDPPAAPTVTPGIWSLAVSWTAPATNGPAINDYDVQYSSDAGASWTEWQSSTTSTATSAAITGLSHDTAYLVQVRAASSAGDGPWSPSASTRTRVRAPSAPAAPTLAPGNATLTASWSAPVDNGFTVLDYDVRYCSTGCTTDSNWTELADVETSDPGQNSSDDSNGPAGDPLNLYPIDFTSVTVAEEQASNSNWGLYKLGANVAGLRVQATGNLWSPTSGKPTIRARHAATKPTNLTTAGTEIWSVTPPDLAGQFTGDAWTLPLLANSYFWVAADAQSKFSGLDGYFQIRVASTATARTVGGLTNGTTYQVQVRAANVKGFSDWSPSATMVAGLPAAVAAPVLEAGARQLRASWAVPADHGSAVTDYDLQYRQGSTGDWTGVSHNGTGRTATIQALANGQNYQVRVRASNARGAGPWSAAASVTVGVPGTPAAPSLTSGNATLTATWTAPASNGSAITDYDMRYSSDSGANWTDVSHTGTGTSATIGSLTNATAYEVQVRATNARGTGAWSPSAADKPGRPQASTAPTLTTPAERQIRAAWSATAANGAAVTDYDIAYRLSSADTWSDWPHTGTGRTATVTGLTPNTGYEVRVRASSAAGPGAWSGTTSATTLTSAPETPAAPSLSAGATSLTVKWDAPADNGASISGYAVQYRQQGATQWTSWAHSGTGTTATITGLTANTAYEVQLRAANGRGNSGWSAIASALTGAPARVGTPTLTPAARQLAVAWTAPASNGADIDDYDVRHRRAGTSTWTVFDGGTHQTPITFNTPDTVDGPNGNPLDNGTVPLSTITRESVGSNAGVYKINSSLDSLDFYFWTTINISGSTTLELRHSSTKPGSGNLHTLGTVLGTATQSTAGQRAFEIDIATGPLSANSYFWIESNTSLSVGNRAFNLGVDLATTATSRTLTGLANSTTYEVQVRAGNSRGDGSWSPAVQATLPGVPAAPAAPTLTRAGNSVSAAWAAPADSGAAITDYDVRYSSDSGTTWTEWSAASTSTATSATITDLAYSTTYQVQVRAANAVGEGPWSASSTVTTGQQAVPGPPGNISGSWNSQTPTTLDVSWSSPGGTYLEYQVMYRTDSDAVFNPSPQYPSTGWSTPSNAPTVRTTAQAITGLISTNIYVLAVRARDRATGRYGGWAISGLIEPTGTPGRPSGVAETDRDASSLTLEWSRVAGANSYDVRVSEDTSPRAWASVLTGVAQTAQGSPGSTSVSGSYLPSGFSQSKTYVAQVRARSTRPGACGTGSVKCSRWVESGSLAQLDITGLTAAKMERGDDPSYVRDPALDMDMQWDALSVSGVSYEVAFYYRDGDPDDYYDDTDDDKLPRSKPDSWRMDWDWFNLCAEHDDSVPTDPLKSRGCDDHTDLNRDGYWRPQWWFGQAHWGAWVALDSTAAKCNNDEVCEYTFSDVTLGHLTSKVRVRAVDGNTKGLISEVTSRPPRTPGPPYKLTATAPTGASFKVCWNKAFHRGSALVGFDIELYDTSAPGTATQTVTGTWGTQVPDTSYRFCYTFHDITTNKTYYAKVQARNGVGASGWAQSANVTLTPTAPAMPLRPTISSPTATSVALAWSAPADDGGSAVTSYSVRYRKQNADLTWPTTWTTHTRSGTGTTTTETISNLTTGSAYQFQVSATNGIGTSDWSTSTQATPGS